MTFDTFLCLRICIQAISKSCDIPLQLYLESNQFKREERLYLVVHNHTMLIFLKVKNVFLLFYSLMYLLYI